jgi:hypothetical protein
MILYYFLNIGKGVYDMIIFIFVYIYISKNRN